MQRESFEKKGQERRKVEKIHKLHKLVHWRNKIGLFLKKERGSLNESRKKTGGKKKKKEKNIKGRKGKRSFQRNVCFASYNGKM